MLLHATYKNVLVYCSSTRGDEATIAAIVLTTGELQTVRVVPLAGAAAAAASLGPVALLALGGRHLAVVAQHDRAQACFYDVNSPAARFTLQYPAEVLQLQLNHRYAAVLVATSPPRAVVHHVVEGKLRVDANVARVRQWFGAGTASVVLFPK